jgi:hypothetical protein
MIPPVDGLVSYCSISMKRLFILSLIMFFFGPTLMAQWKKTRIDNIRMDFLGNRFVIEYDILGSHPDSLHEIDLYVIDNMGNVIFPDSLRGDIGQGISPGENKKVYWDIYSEYDIVYGNFHPRIILDGTEKGSVRGGPANALLSLMVPGLGDYFVADHRKMKIKPYYKTLTAYAFVGLGIASFANREHIPDVMGEPGWYWEYVTVGDDRIWSEVYRQDWIEEPGYTEYWLFPYDGEIFTGIGAAVWLVDIIWVARTGVKNRKVKNEILGEFNLVPVHRGMALSYKYTF